MLRALSGIRNKLQKNENSLEAQLLLKKWFTKLYLTDYYTLKDPDTFFNFFRQLLNNSTSVQFEPETDQTAITKAELFATIQDSADESGVAGVPKK